MKDKAWLSRTQLIVGEEGIDLLSKANVLVVGMGGVGSFAAEFIARSGIGNMTIVDGDVVDPSNRNRQLPALFSTHGKSKVQLMAERIKDINPEVNLNAINTFVTPDAVKEILSTPYDYIVDAIDSFTPKCNFIQAAYITNTPIISSMGAGGRLDPTCVRVADISQTHNCPLAQQVRKKLRQLEIYKGIKAVFSFELPDRDSIMRTDGTNFKKSAFGTMSYLPATFGATAASVVIRDILGEPVPLVTKKQLLKTC